VLPLTERQLIPTAEVDDVADVKRSQAVITLDAESRDIRSTVASQAAAIEQVTSVRGASWKKVYVARKFNPPRKLLLKLGLKGMIGTAPLRLRDNSILAQNEGKVRKHGQGNFSVGQLPVVVAPSWTATSVPAGKTEVNNVGAWKRLQMPRQRGDVARLHGH